MMISNMYDILFSIVNDYIQETEHSLESEEYPKDKEDLVGDFIKYITSID